MKADRALKAIVFAVLLMPSAALAQSATAQPEATAPPVRGGGVTVTIDRDRPTPPDGDPRSAQQRRADHASFTQCVLRAQGRRGEAPFAGALPPDPMMLCQQRLGMANADAVPNSVREKMK